jgi:hypothetical protein
MAGDRRGAAGASGVSGVTAPDPDAIMDRGRETLREIFGFDDFLPSQAASLVAMCLPLCHWFRKSPLYPSPAVMDAGLGHGLTMVLSPLIGLLRRIGVWTIHCLLKLRLRRISCGSSARRCDAFRFATAMR